MTLDRILKYVFIASLVFISFIGGGVAVYHHYFPYALLGGDTKEKHRTPHQAEDDEDNPDWFGL
ncbi:MAG: hypothetical protein EBX37_15105 [Alphaproteobacteria bacterium]|nr:hypothetical protein [Alphaproteobacteria bacterium]